MKNLYSSYSSFLNYLHSLSFEIGKEKIVLLLTVSLLFVSESSYGQVTASNNQYFSNVTVTSCGGNVWKVKAYQSNQWSQGRLNIRYNGTLIGKSCWNCSYWSTNQQTPSNNNGSWAIGGHSGRWVYVKVESGPQKAYGYFSDFTCSSASAPTITTTNISSITCNSASSGGTSINQNGASVTAKGVCWSTSSNPTISNSKTTNGTGTGNFTSSITGLSSGTTYYVRAYATNSAGTGYGSQKNFTTSSLNRGSIPSTSGSPTTICQGSTPTIPSSTDASGESGIYYNWRYKYSTNNGSSWSSWSDAPGTNNNSSYTVPSNLTPGHRHRFRRRAGGACTSLGWSANASDYYVTAAPSAGTLSGTQPICVSGSTTFSSTVSGGTWSSGNTGIATINSSSGAISGVSAGTATITYTKAGSGGCSDATATRTVTVTAAPSAGTLSGTQGICVSGSTTFSSTVSGGTWSSGNTGIATINSSSGAISGVSAGTATITYTKAGSGGCSNATATRTVTVTAAPSAGTLSGTQPICVSGSTTFSSTVSGGTWSSGNTGIATINSSSGAISGVSAGTATITYTKTGSGGCSNATATRTVTVTAAPSAGTLSGTQGICVSGSTTFSSTVSGGTWSSGNTGIATINSSSGAISGVSAGTATITYTKAGSGGCSDATATRTVTVNARPTVSSPINGSRTGTGTVVIQATASSGSIDWYAASSGGSSLGNSASAVNWTTPSISSTTLYYAEANNGTCVSASRTAVVATILVSSDVSGRLSLKNNIYVVLNTVETTGEVFVVLDNDNANALSTGGNIITKHEKNQIKWNIGTNTGNYTIPFTAPNNAKTKIPFSLEITEAGTGSGNVKFSSYTDNDGTNNHTVSDYKPSDVTNMDNGDDEDNSANVINRFWIVDANGYDTDQKPAATLSFNYADHELSSGNNNIAEANIFPQRWNSTTSQWHDVTLSGTPDATNNKISGVTVAKEDFFRSWALVSNVTPLPVELIYFDVKRTGSFVLLEWETLAEINNDYFIVEKSSDGENWEEILTVDGQGNTNEQTYYSQIDVNGCEGVCYYRLIQVDFDGRREKEGIRVLNSDNQNQEFKMTVIPNPMNQRANISFSALEGGVFNLSVLNQTGQEVYSTKTIGDKGNNQILFDSSTLSHGSYYFILEDESGNRIQQLVIK